MDKNYISYDQAISLKRMGFNEPTISGYSYPNSDKVLAQAITYQEAFEWFIKNYGFYTAISEGYFRIYICHSTSTRIDFSSGMPMPIYCETTIHEAITSNRAEARRLSIDQLIKLSQLPHVNKN